MFICALTFTTAAWPAACCLASGLLLHQLTSRQREPALGCLGKPLAVWPVAARVPSPMGPWAVVSRARDSDTSSVTRAREPAWHTRSRGCLGAARARPGPVAFAFASVRCLRTRTRTRARLRSHHRIRSRVRPRVRPRIRPRIRSRTRSRTRARTRPSPPCH